ncbi:Squamosa promoter-binding-like protein 12 [Dendrobium catenatum]|uniref:Squamosa promoter-binding-like protein 12 n=1 Tax=Dendrobium catenatum TaxID=906689 RepID=A0A2I0XAF5_9ASPA|nr:Squamosa promoter-binding-like protein 12 [Dendrobium catenatum]
MNKHISIVGVDISCASIKVMQRYQSFNNRRDIYLESRVSCCGLGLHLLDFGGLELCSLCGVCWEVEADMGGDIHQIFSTDSSRGQKQKTQEWDLNEWTWDGEGFVAVPVNPRPLDCNKQPCHDVCVSNTSLTGSDECNYRIIGKGLGEADKRRRILVVEDDKQCDEVGSLTLKLGGQIYPIMEDDLDVGGMKNGKRGLEQASNLNHPKCQVEGCDADLSQCKDYHRPDKSQLSKDSELLWNLLRNIASLASSSDANKSSSLQASHDLQKVGTSARISGQATDARLSGVVPLTENLKQSCSPAKTKCAPTMATNSYVSVSAASREMNFQHNTLSPLQHMLPGAYNVEGERTKGFDLNATFVDEHDGELGCERLAKQATLVIGSSGCPPWMVKNCHQLCPPQISGNTESTSTRSPSSSNGDAQSRTDRIVFKLFGKHPNDFPLALRAQMVMIGLTTVGQVVLNKTLVVERTSYCKILSVTPIAAPPSSRVTFKVKGSNLVRPTTRLFCAFEGRYLIQEMDKHSVNCSNNGSRHEQFQSLSFSCYLSDAIGRGFIEVEDAGLSSGFFPFIVAEEDICTEIRMLESSMDVASCDEVLEEKLVAVRNLGLNFLHEMGWLLRRSQLRSRSESENHCSEVFSLPRFRWILRFSMDRDWSAIVKKLLDFLFDGIIDLEGVSPTKIALSENLLHYAVQRNSKLTVKLLLRYRPCKNSDRAIENLFRPDMPGPSNITPLHVAASSIYAESMLDLLTDDPGQFGVKAWKTARDSTGFTPEDYAFARGHESYLTLMQTKLKKLTEKTDVAVNMPYKPSGKFKSEKLSSLEIDKSKSKSCKLCERPMAYRSSVGSSLLYRPMLLSMVGIAAVCVCVALIFKGPPEVLFVYPPFRWELLEYGYM